MQLCQKYSENLVNESENKKQEIHISLTIQSPMVR